MDARRWFREIKEEFYLLRTYWVPLVRESFFDAFFSWFNIFIFGLLSVLYSLAITIYREEAYTMSDFFPPHFGWGLVLAFFTMFLYRLAVDTAKQVKSHKLDADLYTPNGIEVEVFNPDEMDTRLAGILVTNMKGQSIKAGATVRRLMRNNRNVLEDQHHLKWESENHYGFAILEPGKSELLFMERRLYEMPKNVTKGMTKHLGSEQVREIETRVILETNTEPYLELFDGDKCVIEIEFWFIINNLYLKDYILQCRIENNKGKLRIEKIRQWMNKNDQK